MNKRFTAHESRQLIELVKQYPSLYIENTVKSKKGTQEIWKYIARELNKSGRLLYHMT